MSKSCLMSLLRDFGVIQKLTRTFRATCILEEMIVLPPAAPPDKTTSPFSFSMIYGQLELRGFFPPVTARLAKSANGNYHN